jgi:hypothetical protein
MRRSVKATTIALATLLCLSAPMLRAQAISAAPSKHTTDIAITYTAEHANSLGGGGSFWLQGGSVEAGVSLWHGLALAGNFTGTHASSVGSQNVSLGLATYTFGPRYRYSFKSKPASVFGELLLGGVKGFDGLFPNSTGATSSASAFAMQAGLGVDWKLRQHIDLRPLELAWVRMQLPNGTSNTQNDLRISSGLLYSF